MIQQLWMWKIFTRVRYRIRYREWLAKSSKDTTTSKARLRISTVAAPMMSIYGTDDALRGSTDSLKFIHFGQAQSESTCTLTRQPPKSCNVTSRVRHMAEVLQNIGRRCESERSYLYLHCSRIRYGTICSVQCPKYHINLAA